MRQHWIWAGGLILITLVGLGGPAWGIITRLTPLRDVLAENRFIAVARVEKVDPGRPATILTVEEDLKGKLPYRRLPVNLTGDADAKKDRHTDKLLARLAPKLPVVLFGNQRGKRLTVFGYTNGTWFQMVGQKGDGDEPIVWAFTHCEPFLRRTFKGTTAEMRQVIVDGLAGKKKPPEADPKEPPGLGPEAKQEKSSRLHLEDASPRVAVRGFFRGTLFAVIPTLGIGGPLAILALLFPSLFGGVLLLFRRWIAFFTVVSINSTLYFLHLWLAGYFLDSWWSTPTALWLAMTLVTLLGTLWAYARHVRTLTGDQVLPEAPPRTENLVLGLLSGTCALVLGICLLSPPPASEPWWNLLLVFTLGIWAGGLYRLYRAAREFAQRPALVLAGGPPPLVAERAVALALARVSGALEHFGPVPPLAAVPALADPVARPPSRPTFPTEAVILWVALFASTAFAAARPGARLAPLADDTTGAERGGAKLLPERTRTKVFEGTGMILSSPLVADGRIYLAAARGALDRFGTLYCLDAKTLDIIWAFDDDGAMKQVFSSPCLAGGRVYIGEGFHEDSGCKLYCVEAKTGRKVWDFSTGSHTEGTPVVVGGRVYFSAGDDGIYCVEADRGKKVWQFPDGARRKTLRLHVDMTPAVAGKRVYVGGGIDEETGVGDGVIVCLDANTGKEIWVRPTPRWMVRRDDPQRTPLALPVWGSPAVDRGQVFFGLGNGRMTGSSEKYDPAGALLCVDAATGKDLWPPFRTGDGVLARPVLDGGRVYFGSRDGYCYCVDRQTGALRWKKSLGSAVVAVPALDSCGHCGKTSAVFALGCGGHVCCLDPHTGKVQWRFTTLEQSAPLLASSPAVVTAHTPQGDRRQIYFGATLNNFSIPALYCLEDLAPER